MSGFGGTRGRHDKPDGRGRSDAPAPVSVLKMLSVETSQTVGLDLRTSRTSAAHTNSSLDEKKIDHKSQSNEARKVEPKSARVSLSSASGSSRQTGLPSSKLGRPTFMRPAGVDSPTTKPRAMTEKRERPTEDESANLNSGSPGDSGRRKKKKKNGGSNANSDAAKSLGETR